MIPGPPPSEIPPPGRPVPAEPGRRPDGPAPLVPMVPRPDVDRWPDPARDGLRAQRRVLLTGRLDAPVVERACAELMLLDGRAADPVTVVLTSAGGPVDDVFALLDVLALMRAPVAVQCVGAARGTAVAVLASGTGTRSATSRATIELRVAETTTIDGRADDVRRGADALADAHDRLAGHLAHVSDMTIDQVRQALRDGPPLSAHDAAALGLIDAVV